MTPLRKKMVDAKAYAVARSGWQDPGCISTGGAAVSGVLRQVARPGGRGGTATVLAVSDERKESGAQHLSGCHPRAEVLLSLYAATSLAECSLCPAAERKKAADGAQPGGSDQSAGPGATVSLPGLSKHDLLVWAAVERRGPVTGQTDRQRSDGVTYS